MSHAFWIALFTALPPTIVALATLISSIRNNAALKVNTNLTSGTSDKVDHVHSLVNGRLEDALRKIEELERQMKELGCRWPEHH